MLGHIPAEYTPLSDTEDPPAMTSLNKPVEHTAQIAAAKRLIEFAEHVSGSRKYMFVCTPEGDILAIKWVC